MVFLSEILNDIPFVQDFYAPALKRCLCKVDELVLLVENTEFVCLYQAAGGFLCIGWCTLVVPSQPSQ